MASSSTNISDRTPEQILEHYKIEKELANRLMSASKEERCILYATLYDELYKRVRHHPQLTRKISSLESRQAIRTQLKFLSPFLKRNSIFVEVGAGDCALSFEVAKQVNSVYAIDVSQEVSRSESTPSNFQLILSDGCSIPVPCHSVDVVYSNQLMEHLHPDDAFEQLRNIYNVLQMGGCYICVTPNRLTGPHDISMYFDRVASGFHLKEYSISELISLFLKVGFSKVELYALVKGKRLNVPVNLLTLIERLLNAMPYPISRALAASPLFRGILNARVVGIK